MLFGFTLIVIFYYLGKTHEHKMKTIEVYSDFMEGSEEMVNDAIKENDVYKRVIDMFAPTVLRDYYIGRQQKLGDDIQAFKNNLKPWYNELISSFEDIPSVVISLTSGLILSFSISLAMCLVGLFFSESELLGQTYFLELDVHFCGIDNHYERHEFFQ